MENFARYIPYLISIYITLFPIQDQYINCLNHPELLYFSEREKERCAKNSVIEINTIGDWLELPN